ncbi:hypothetical protein BGLCM_0632 [Bifidobacterium gallicum DSM 20093 = LMG 11596]|uniref:Uncharacterized protein n=1 Tax=Bifidobacterium gallicum DSM 20093 = LMG 11596 TaxID=561180 RepID=A0A087AJU8_9BIFI|nr:hypothetical protein BGLCM_0632 [Bifidobacterium gallicum DSM 20093 = LMG 11596]
MPAGSCVYGLDAVCEADCLAYYGADCAVQVGSDKPWESVTPELRLLMCRVCTTVERSRYGFGSKMHVFVPRWYRRGQNGRESVLRLYRGGTETVRIGLKRAKMCRVCTTVERSRYECGMDMRLGMGGWVLWL